jgi:MFS family permease
MYAGGAIGVRVLGARLPDRVGVHNMVVPSLGLYVVALLVVAGGETTAHFQLAGLLAGLGHGYGFPVITSLVISRTPSSSRGAAMSGFTGLWDVSMLTLAPLAGALADAAGDRVMFSLMALLGVGMLAMQSAVEHVWGSNEAPS